MQTMLGPQFSARGDIVPGGFCAPTEVASAATAATIPRYLMMVEQAADVLLFKLHRPFENRTDLHFHEREKAAIY